jgi:superoxide dismutase, Fe-Mn family
MITRRNAIQTITLGAAAYALGSSAQAQTPVSATPTSTPADPTGPHTLPPLSFAVDALEPHLDAATMTLHHDKHHAAYIKNLNKALVGQPAALVAKSAEALIQDLASVPEAIRTTIRNNAGGHVNHTLFWQMLNPKGEGMPKGDLAKVMDSTFGSFSAFQESFNTMAMKVFGSGWAWLSLTKEKKLIIESTPNQDCPLSVGNFPLLGIDVWEHAYYLKYQNRRVDYLKAVAHVIDWDFVAERYAQGMKS